MIEFVKDYFITIDGEVYSNKRNMLHRLKQTNVKGYKKVTLYIERKPTYARVHRLVATAFIPNFYKKPWVNHKDGNKINNNALNLEWSTISENHIHARELGLRNKNCKINSVLAKKIRKEAGTLAQIGKKYGLHKTTIGRIKNNKLWMGGKQ